jgi:pentatricopeptide repeat protein
MMVLQSSSSSSVTKSQETVLLSKQQHQDCIKCYELILNGWCKSKYNGAEIIAEEILHRLLSFITTTTTKVATADATTATTTTSIRMTNNNFNMVRHYNNVIICIAASCKIDAGVHAERLLFELIHLSSSSSSLLNGGKQGRVRGPDRNTYNAVMNAYAKSHSSSSSSNTSTRISNSGNSNNSNDNSNNDAITNIERILQMMDTQSKLHGNNNPDAAAKISPDKISYTILLTAYASSSSNTNNNNDDMGKKAEEILQHMIREYTVNGNTNLKPDTVTYNAVMNAYAKAHSGCSTSTKCMNLLNDMLQRYNETGDPDIRPDGVTFNTVLHAIANDASLGSKDSNKKGLLVDDDDDDDDNDDDDNPPKRAVRLLEQMLLMGYQPDIITYNSILDAFAKHGSVESAHCAEVMLNNLEELYDETKNLQQQHHLEQECRSSTTSLWDVPCPDIYSYNIVINAWANCGQADKAVALLDRMSTRTRENKAMLIPDVTTYNTILHSWSQSLDRNAPVKAFGLLEVMIRLHNNSNSQIGDDDDDDDDDDDNLPSNTVTTTSAAATTTSKCILDVTSFSTVINSFAKSRYPRKARQARMLLTRLKSFNHGSGRAVGTMRRKNETLLRPNIYVYTAVLNSCAYSYGSEKDEALRIGISTYEELQRSTEIKTNTSRMALLLEFVVS